MTNPNLTMHEWDILFSLIQTELDRTQDRQRISELEKLTKKIEESMVI